MMASEMVMGTSKPVRGQHLEGNECQHGAEAVVQVAQAIEQRGKGEVERPQSENCGDVRGVDDERVAGDGEHGGNRIHGKQNVCDFDGEDDRKQRTLCRLQAANPLGYGCARGTAAHKPICRIEQEQAEDPADPLEALDQSDAHGR